MPKVYRAVISLLVLVGLFVIGSSHLSLLELLIPSYAVSKINFKAADHFGNATSTVFFTGDVMLARHVESHLIHNGSNYPYRKLSWFKDEQAYVVGNFESAIPVVHRKSPTGTFRFSTDKVHLSALREAGFSHVSLANNHALDFGPADFTNAAKTLTERNIESFGHPTVVSSSSLSFLSLGGERIALIALHTLFIEPSRHELEVVFKEAIMNSDFQIIYIHWGNEYEPLPSTREREMAKLLVELGADLVIGHHPHITQAVENVSGIPVFYSLGNFIFDQYFSEKVQDGLVLKLKRDETEYRLTLLPVTTRSTQAQPRLMEEDEREVYLKDLATISAPELADYIVTGELTIPLATLTETAIMGE